MRPLRPRSLNGLILVGFGLVGLPLLIAVIWALFNLDRLAEQSEQLVATGVEAAEKNRVLQEHLGSLERVARQYQVLGNAESLDLLYEDLGRIDAHLETMAPLAEKANSMALAASIGAAARRIVNTLEEADLGAENEAARAIAEFALLRERTTQLTNTLTLYVDTELRSLQESTRRAQRVSAWQVAALVPGTLILVLFFIVLVARPIRQLDGAISQLGQSGFSKPIEVKGPTDLERLGRQLEWVNSTSRSAR